eukprot:TRINITY_DN4097_c0_g1_i1.p1 TRINITY_DN4097_c0_g1~~TRINITY_DN4097_c0_g1_i1.p1  ORF type:complete len:497 (-),score=101.57 TRINITY_DN4097_c0_g1_i1:89-1579(-)
MHSLESFWRVSNREDDVPSDNTSAASLQLIDAKASPVQNCIVEGYLYKKGDKGLIKAWLKRWFSLKDGFLYYYRNRFSNELCGKIDLSIVSLIRATHPSSFSQALFPVLHELGTDGYFKIVAGSRTFFLLAETKEEMEKWVRVLEQVNKRLRDRKSKSVAYGTILANWVMLESSVSLEEHTIPKLNISSDGIQEDSRSLLKSPSSPGSEGMGSVYPLYWDLDFDSYKEVILPTDSEEYVTICKMMNTNVGAHGHRFGTVRGKDPAGFLVRRVVRIQSADLWSRYEFVRNQIRKQCRFKMTEKEGSRYMSKKPALIPLLDPSTNEYQMFHGTRPEVADILKKKGFDERVASTNGMFGAGLYFAENSSKSNQYVPCPQCGKGAIFTPDVCRCKEPILYSMFLCRVLLGDMHIAINYNSKKYKGTDLRWPVRRPPPISEDSFELYDSVMGESKENGGDVLQYREFIVYDRYQVYPEYLIYYERLPAPVDPTSIPFRATI